MATRLLPVTCNQCGAPLSVPEDVRFVTCAHCDTSLSVEHEGDAYFTRALEELGEKAEQIDAKLDSVERQLQRQNLDLQWEIDRKKLMVRSKEGDLVVPKRADSPGSIAQLAIGGVIICVFLTIASQVSGGGAMFGLFAVIAGVAMLFGIISEHSKAVRYERARRRYRDSKARLGSE